MSLADELRATLTREADQHSTPLPDVGRLIGGGRRRRRRRTALRSGVAAAAVLACAAVYGVSTSEPTGSRSEHVATRPSPVPTMDGERPQLTDGGTYRVLVGRTATGEAIEADFTVQGDNWVGGDYARVSDGNGANAGFGIYQPTALAAGSGCLQDRTSMVLPTTPEDLAAMLAALPRSSVLQPPATTTAFGLPAVHVRMRVDVSCAQTYYRVAEAPSGSRGISYGMVDKGVVIDFWTLGLGGRPVVVDLWHSINASPQLVQRAADARDSISFATGD
ncbi:hypothetical protein ACS3YM_08520 [Nocardia sp. N13]|uniref:hypothetical protein n=1 Tax=Nocardioides sp. N13(2025) TaxID=3453405 RepID=UPI003F757C46